MPPSEDRDSALADPASSTAAPVSAEQTPSVIRPVDPKAAPATSDTLMSAPTLTRADLQLEERLSIAERNLSELMLRVERLERRPLETPEAPTRPTWIWLVFLAALAIAWQIVARLE